MLSQILLKWDIMISLYILKREKQLFNVSMMGSAFLKGKSEKMHQSCQLCCKNVALLELSLNLKLKVGIPPHVLLVF